MIYQSKKIEVGTYNLFFVKISTVFVFLVQIILLTDSECESFALIKVAGYLNVVYDI